MGSVVLPPNWTHLRPFDDLPADTRWHLVALIGFCSRRCRLDGVITWDEAVSVSDVPTPERCIADLLDSGQLDRAADGVRVVEVTQFLTSKRTEAERDDAAVREREKARRRKARQRAKVSHAVFERDGWVCLHCGTSDDLTIDHIYPQVLGGSDVMSNLQTLCRVCNARKGISVVAADN